METINVADLHLLGEDIDLIDVREPEEVAEVRIPFATFIPLSQFAERIDEVPEGSYIMCHAGGRSARAVAYLAEHGKQATNVEGGISTWEAEGLPVQRG